MNLSPCRNYIGVGSFSCETVHFNHTLHAFTLGQQSDLVLLARNKKALEVTKSEIQTVTGGVRVHLFLCDLGDLERLPAVCKEMLEIADSSKHSQFVLINSAGTMNSFEKPFEAFSEPKEIQDYFAINYTSMAVLTGLFLSSIPNGRRYVVNITSLLATVFFPRFPLYAPAKAARHAYMGVLTAEKPDVRTLNYSPGVCVTDMTENLPKEITDGFAQMITCKESIDKFVQILKMDLFENGAVIDYYD